MAVGIEGSWPGSWGPERTGKRLVDFQLMWQEIIREWSERWGTKIRGWWIDGCYFADEMYRHDDEPNFQSFADSLRAGNPDAIICFNPGVKLPIICHTEVEDYTAGEVSKSLCECPGPWVERNGHKARYHVLTYMGSDWCGGDGPRFPNEMATGYTKHVTGKGGVVTWDVPITTGGLIAEGFIGQLKAIANAVNE